MGSIGMVVDTTEERCCTILADHLRNEVTATRMLIDERGDVVDEASDNDQGTLHRLLLDWAQAVSRGCLAKKRDEKLTAIPADNRQVSALGGPVQPFLLIAKTLELHGKLALRHLVLGEDLQVTGETELCTDPDEPLGGVVLVPLDRVTVVHGELVVEVVVTLADRDKGRNHVVARCVLVVEGRLSEPVREGVNAEGRLRPE